MNATPEQLDALVKAGTRVSVAIGAFKDADGADDTAAEAVAAAATAKAATEEALNSAHLELSGAKVEFDAALLSIMG